MKLINGRNVFFFLLLAISLNAIAVLSHIHSHIPSIALPPNFASTPSPTAVSEHESETRSAPAPSPTAASEHELKTRSAPAPSPTAALEHESETRSAPAPSPTAASADEFYFDAAESALSAVDTTELIQICDTTSSPELCKSTISSHISESTAVDPTSALKTEIQESIKVVEGGVAKLKALRKEGAASKVEMGCYDTCLENFDLAIFDLRSGLESIDAKDTGTMESVLAAVETNLVTCDDTFVEMGVASPLENLSTKMKKYAATCLEISKLLM